MAARRRRTHQRGALEQLPRDGRPAVVYGLFGGGQRQAEHRQPAIDLPELGENRIDVARGFGKEAAARQRRFAGQRLFAL